MRRTPAAPGRGFCICEAAREKVFLFYEEDGGVIYTRPRAAIPHGGGGSSTAGRRGVRTRSNAHTRHGRGRGGVCPSARAQARTGQYRRLQRVRPGMDRMRHGGVFGLWSCQQITTLYTFYRVLSIYRGYQPHRNKVYKPINPIGIKVIYPYHGYRTIVQPMRYICISYIG